MKYLPLLFGLIITGCNYNSEDNSKSEELFANEMSRVPKNYELLDPFFEPDADTLKFLAEHEFTLAATGDDKGYWENDIVPWVSIDSPDLANLIDADEKLVPYNSVWIAIDYPITKPFLYKVTATNGFTRKELMQAVSDKYHSMYREEEASANVKTVPVAERKLVYNRNETDGIYGICCHDIGDLVLSSIILLEGPSGTIYVYLYIQS